MIRYMKQETDYIVVYHLFDITQEGEIQERIGYGDKKKLANNERGD